MDSGFYSAFTGLASRMDALDVVANNLANISTMGFKAQHEFYRSYSSWLQPSLTTPINQAVNQYGVLGGASLDLSPGSFSPTGNDTDMALENSGFFTVQTKNGVRYTRAGNFSLNAQRQLVTNQGDTVMSEQGTILVPIQVPSGHLAVSPDGTISVDGTLVAKLKITDFAPNTALTMEGNSYFVAPQDAAKPAAQVSVRQGSLETSNADPVMGAVALIEVQRTAGLMEKALSIFHNEFNRVAAQQLSVV
ncbi:MAG TPA: flagellar hook basal-body protein [Candidatus Acidoferrum sp.]|jgi:flagellar basal-body rod protein FlgF/flagellar basal-body rod protein FlgG